MKALREFNNRYLLVPKVLYFFISLNHYTLHKFRPLFVRDMFGIGEKQLGRIGFLAFLVFFTNIFIGAMNDRFGHPRAFIVALLVLSCIFFQLFYIDAYINSSPFMFWINLFAYLSTNMAIPALLDKAVLDNLNRIPGVTPKIYGKQRIWGTVGYFLSIFIIEGIVKNQEGNKIDFTNLRYYSLVTTVIGVVLSMTLMDECDEKNRGSSQELASGWKTLIRNREYLFFMLIIFLNGFTRSAMTLYLPTYMKHILNIKPYDLSSWYPWISGVIGVFNNFPFSTITMFEISFEIVILFYSQVITQRIGLFWPLLLAQVCQMIRFSMYLILPHTNPNVFIFCCMFELLKGVNFGLAHGSGVQLAAKMCPPHLKSTSQMMYQGTFTALGSVASGLFFSLIFNNEVSSTVSDQKIRSFQLFFIYNIIITIVTIVLFLYKYGIRDGRLLNTKRKSMPHENQIDEPIDV